MTEHHSGSRYVSGRDVATIAQLVRADIADAVRQKTLPEGKYRVRISRYSMGCSLTIQASGIAGVLNRARAEHGIREPHAPPAGHAFLSEHGQEIERTLTAIADAYQRTDSDRQTDYHNTNFYLHVHCYTSEESNAFYRAVAAQIAAEKASPRAVVLQFPDRVETIRRETGRMPDDMPRPPAASRREPAEDQAEWLAWLESTAVR